MRRTAGKAASDPILLGEPRLSEVAALALADAAEVDRLTHGFHTWPAGLHPDAARRLVEALPGASVLDPFCGGGTVLVEARVAGRMAYGRDLSPVAVRVATARSGSPDEALLTRFRSKARKLVEAARAASVPPESRLFATVEEWYAPHVLWELESLRAGIAASEDDIRPLLEVCFSSILVKVSWRKSDTQNQRVKHKRPPGTTAILFHKKVRELGRRMAALREVVPEGTPDASVELCDAREVTVPTPVDLVLTSPPYPSTYDYLPIQHLRTAWLGDRPHLDREIGSRRSWREGARKARKTWREDTDAWMAASARALNPGGYLVVVIGDGLAPSGTVDTSQPSEDSAHKAGLTSVARASVERIDHARDSTRWEHVLFWQKPE